MKGLMTMTTMNRIRRTLATAAIGGVALTGIGMAAAGPASAAAPAAAPAPASTAPAFTGSGNVNVNLDPVAIANAIKDAVNDQSDRSGAVKAALDVGYWNNGNPDRMTVAVVNKNQDIQVSGDVAHAESIDIKGGSYVIYWFKGSAEILNNGDGGWLNWGAFGNIERASDNLIKVNGGF